MNAIAFAVLLFAIACGGSTDPRVASAPSVSGKWSGTIVDPYCCPRYLDTLSLTLTEASGQVSGSGAIALPTSVANGHPPTALTPTGTFDAPTVILALQATANPSLSVGQLVGTLSNSGDEIVATISGFSGQTITLARAH